MIDQAPAIAAERAAQAVKCVVWDLDNTLWDGVLLEDGAVRLRPAVAEAIKLLDGRGILQSIASRNDPATALAQLEASGLAEYFLYPQIGWGAKSEAIERIASLLNLGLDSFAFVDDQPFEREEVAFRLPAVLVVDAEAAPTLPELPRLQPRFVTEDARVRRQLYRSDMARKVAEEQFGGPSEAFLATLGMALTLAEATEDDLQRAEELTLRTNQLNSTGYTYSYEELDAFRRSPDHLLLVARLEDRYGGYGTIGLALVERGAAVWTLKLLLMSCRVMARGVGTIVLHQVMRWAKRAGATLQAEFVSTERNRMMYVTYKFGGFAELRREGSLITLAHDLATIPDHPPYVTLQLIGALGTD